jgi:glucosylceramidase
LWAFSAPAGAQICAAPGESTISVYETRMDRSRSLRARPALRFGADVAPSQSAFDIHPEKTLQTMNGFGAAMTESCAMNLERLPDRLKHEALARLFSKTRGAGLSYVRIPMGASDFSDPARPYYSYDDTPDGAPDPSFKHFDMSRDEKSFRLLREALRLNPDLRVLISPWSPPGWMKTSKSMVGGTLEPSHYGDLARYFVRAIEEYENRGIPVTALTVQNEPGYGDADYPCMGMSNAEQITFMRDHLRPELRRHHLRTEIYVLDHNYDQFNDVNDILGALRGQVAGAAYHCYEGDYSQMSNSTKAHPEAPPFLTECTGVLGGDRGADFAGWIGNYILRPIRAGATGALAWNLCLDEKGGPHHGGCATCRGLLTTDFSGAGPALRENPEMTALAHLSRFVEPGARRIELKEHFAGDLVAAAFLNPDGRVGLTVWNSGKARSGFRVDRGCQGFSYALAANSAATFVWQEAGFLNRAVAATH